jgi:hypothetical protein
MSTARAALSAAIAAKADAERSVEAACAAVAHDLRADLDQPFRRRLRVKFSRAGVGFDGAACTSTPEIERRPANYAVFRGTIGQKPTACRLT